VPSGGKNSRGIPKNSGSGLQKFQGMCRAPKKVGQVPKIFSSLRGSRKTKFEKPRAHPWFSRWGRNQILSCVFSRFFSVPSFKQRPPDSCKSSLEVAQMPKTHSVGALPHGHCFLQKVVCLHFHHYKNHVL